MKKQLLIIGGGFASFWRAVSAIRQSLEMLAINMGTDQNSKIGNFLTPINNDLMRKDSSVSLEEIDTSLTPSMNWIDEDTSQGGEFLDDALRIKNQPWGYMNKQM